MRNSKKILAGALACASLAISAQSPKNVLFILADDLGWCDVTLYGKTKLYETPNLERLHNGECCLLMHIRQVRCHLLLEQVS